MCSSDLGIAALLTRLSGFARDIVLAAFFGAGAVSDAFILAFTIPDTLLVFVSGAVAASFIPMYHRVIDKTKFTRNIMTCLLLTGILFSVIFTMLPGALVRLFAFQVAPETFELAEYFVRYMVWSAAFALLVEIYNARLEINGAFFSSGIRNLWRNAVIIIGLALGAVYNNNLMIALAPVAGSALCMISLSLGCRKHGFTYRPYLDIRSPELKQTLILTGPIFLSNAAGQIKAIISRNFAASLPVGTISALDYSFKVAGLFAALIGQALFTVLFPHMSKLAADSDMRRLKSTLTRSIMCILAIMLPICAVVAVLAEPGVRILFERGSFTPEDTALTAACLRMYALIAFTASINPLLMRAFYAIQNTKTPARISIASVIASTGLNLLFIGPLGAEGLALSGSLSGLLMTMLLLIFLRKKMGRLGMRAKLQELVKIAFAAGAVGTGAWLTANALPLMIASALWSAFLCSVIAVGSALLYAILLILLKSKTASEIMLMLMSREA